VKTNIKKIKEDFSLKPAIYLQNDLLHDILCLHNELLQVQGIYAVRYFEKYVS